MGNEITHDVNDCDVFFIPGVTIVDRNEVEKAESLKKPIVFRVDNIPRKSRNKRSRVMDNMKRYAQLAQVVVYQSKWAEIYCGSICGDGTIIYNGVDSSIFYPAKSKPDHEIVLFAYHGNNELKQFWVAHYNYQVFHRSHPDAEFWFIYDFGREYENLKNANFDFWNGEKFKYILPLNSPDEMARIMRMCTQFVYPAIADASPNVVLEARACKLNIWGYPEQHMAGTAELVDPELDISLERMCKEYHGLFDLLLNEKDVQLQKPTSS